MRCCDTTVRDVGEPVEQFRPILGEPAEALGKIAIDAQAVAVADCDGKHGNRARDGVGLDRKAAAIRKLEGVEIVALVFMPEAALPVAHPVDGCADVNEMLEELGGDVLVDGVVLRELERNGEHVEAVHRHPARAVGLVQLAP